MAKLLALLPFIQLQHSVGPLGPPVWGEAEVVQAVVGVLVLAESAGLGAMAWRFWQCLIGIHRCVLVLGWWRSTGEGVLSGGGAVNKKETERISPGNSNHCESLYAEAVATVTYPLCSAFWTLTHCSTCSRVFLLFTCTKASDAAGSGTLWYVPAAMPLGSNMGLGVETSPFLVRLDGSVDVARDGAWDGTLDTGAEVDMWSDIGGRLDGRELCVSISRAELPTGRSSVITPVSL